MWSAWVASTAFVFKSNTRTHLWHHPPLKVSGCSLFLSSLAFFNPLRVHVPVCQIARLPARINGAWWFANKGYCCRFYSKGARWFADKEIVVEYVLHWSLPTRTGTESLISYKYLFTMDNCMHLLFCFSCCKHNWGAWSSPAASTMMTS